MAVLQKMFQVVGVLLVALVTTTLSRSEAPATAPNADFVDALWMAESTGALKVALADGRVLVRIRSGGRLNALALDEAAGTLWAYGDHTLYAYSLAGELRSQTPIAPAADAAEDDEEEGRQGRLVVQPLDGSVWLGLDKTLYRLDPQGERLASFPLADRVIALSVDPRRGNVWAGINSSPWSASRPDTESW